MRFVITPHNILNCKLRTLITTDDYDDDEIKDGRHIRDIKQDFKDVRIRSVWNSNMAWIYPLLEEGPDTKHYFKIKI